MQVLTTALDSPRSPQVQRRAYSDAIVSGTVPLPPRVQAEGAHGMQVLTLPPRVEADVKLCGAHCSLSDGVPPEAW
jgi:hypothetical protein